MAEALIEVKEDLVDGSGFQITADGVYYVRQFIIRNLPRTPAENIYLRAYQAMETVVYDDETQQEEPFIPQLCDPHPLISGLVVERISLSPFENSRTSVRATVYYRDVLGTRVRVNGALSREMTRFDKDGQLLCVNYKAGGAADVEPTGIDVQKHYADAPFLAPGAIVEFDQVRQAVAYDAAPEAFDAATQHRGTPFDLAAEYFGAVNLDPWQGQPERTWACVDCSGAPFGAFGLESIHTNPVTKPTEYWHYHFAFQFVGYRRNELVNTHEAVLVYLRPTTRTPPDGLNPKDGLLAGKTAGNGWKKVGIQSEANFAALNLPRITTRPDPAPASSSTQP